MHARLWRLLAGEDSTARGGLPIHELLAPVPLAALVVLIVNDWGLKGSGLLPQWLVGKLSDFAGVLAFPLVLTAACDLVLAGAARLGAPVDPTLRRWKLWAAVVLTGGVFAAMKLSGLVTGWAESAWAALVPGSTIEPDPTDALALLVLPITVWHGRRALARGAYGRLALARRRGPDGDAAPFADAAACGADRALVDELDAATRAWVRGGPAEPVDAALARLRG